jgi:hypothetical protein
MESDNVRLYQIDCGPNGAYWEVYYNMHYSTSVFEEEIGDFILQCLALGVDVSVIPAPSLT